jgi:hypothetical protein
MKFWLMLRAIMKETDPQLEDLAMRQELGGCRGQTVTGADCTGANKSQLGYHRWRGVWSDRIDWIVRLRLPSRNKLQGIHLR